MVQETGRLLPLTTAQLCAAKDYLRLLPGFPAGFAAAFLTGALGTGFFDAGFAAAFAAGLPLAGDLGGGAV